MNIISSHILMIVLTVVLVIMMIFGIKSLSDQWSGFVEDSQKDSICLDLRRSVMDVYQPDVLDENSVFIKKISIPERLAGKNYFIESKNHTFEIGGYGNISYCNIGVPVFLTGRANGGSVILTYQKIGGSDVVNIKNL